MTFINQDLAKIAKSDHTVSDLLPQARKLKFEWALWFTIVWTSLALLLKSVTSAVVAAAAVVVDAAVAVVVAVAATVVVAVAGMSKEYLSKNSFD